MDRIQSHLPGTTCGCKRKNICVYVYIFIFLLDGYMPYKTFEDLITKEKWNMMQGVQLKTSSLVQSILFPSISTHPYHLFKEQKLSYSVYEAMQNFICCIQLKVPDLHFRVTCNIFVFSRGSVLQTPKCAVTAIKLHLEMERRKHVAVTGQ